MPFNCFIEPKIAHTNQKTNGPKTFQSTKNDDLDNLMEKSANNKLANDGLSSLKYKIVEQVTNNCAQSSKYYKYHASVVLNSLPRYNAGVVL